MIGLVVIRVVTEIETQGDLENIKTQPQEQSVLHNIPLNKIGNMAMARSLLIKGVQYAVLLLMLLYSFISAVEL